VSSRATTSMATPERISSVASVWRSMCRVNRPRWPPGCAQPPCAPPHRELFGGRRARDPPPDRQLHRPRGDRPAAGDVAQERLVGPTADPSPRHQPGGELDPGAGVVLAEAEHRRQVAVHRRCRPPGRAPIEHDHFRGRRRSHDTNRATSSTVTLAQSTWTVSRNRTTATRHGDDVRVRDRPGPTRLRPSLRRGSSARGVGALREGRGAECSRAAESPRYDSDRRATMIFDTPCRVADDPGVDERRAWAGRVLPETPWWPTPQAKRVP
jgi:hypothetical protein